MERPDTPHHPLLRVRDMPQRLRPREEIQRRGVEHVGDDTLLAILLRSGARGLNVLDLARRLLGHYGSLTLMARASLAELAGHHGLGPVKAQVLKAALELARRLSEESAADLPRVRSPDEVFRLLRETARIADEERFWVLLLDTRNRLKCPPIEVTRGILDASPVHPREVFREAIRSSTAAVILAHNHPSGDPSPSAEDIRLTRQLVQAGRVVDIRVLDHIILGRPQHANPAGFLSLREQNLVVF